MENKFKKISSAVPKENDFIDVIISLKEQYYDEDDDCFEKFTSAQSIFTYMFGKVHDEFPSQSQIDPFYRGILHQRFNYLHYVDALGEVLYASMMMINICAKYMRLLTADECDSLDKCTSLKRDAFACILTVVKICMPNLEFLDKVREHMANLDDDDGGVDGAYKHDEGFRVSQLSNRVFTGNVMDLVDPQLLVWLEELDRDRERVPSQSFKDDGLKLLRCDTSHPGK